MGSCENTTLVNEPLHEVAAAEQHSCSESMQNLVPEQRDCIANDSNGNCAGELGEDETSGCERSRDIDFRDGIKHEGQMFGFDLKELMGDACSERTVCLEKNLGEIAADASCSKELVGYMCGDSVVGLENNQGKHVDDSGLDELMGDRCDDSVVCLEENQGESVDGSGSRDLMGMCRNSAVYSNGNQGENVDGSFAEELMGDRCCGSTVCFKENQSENVDGAASKELIGDKDGDCMICSNENQDENVDGSGSKEMMGDRCGDAVVCLNDNQGENLDGSGPEELMGDGDSTGYSNENQCENVDRSGSKELMGDRVDNHVVCLDENQGNIDKNDSETDLLCLKNRGSSGEDGATAMDGSLGLSQEENTACLSSGTDISTNCEDQMKCDDENVVGLVLKEFMNNQGGCLIENKGIIDHHDSENDASQDGEMPSELKMVTTSPRNCVKKDKQKDDQRVSGSIMQGIMENVEEKSEEKNDVVERTGTDALNQFLSSQKCEVSFELISVTGEPRNKNDTSTSCSSVEVAMEEKREILAEIETKLCNQMPSIQGSNLPSESIAIAGCRSDCPQQNDLKDSNIVRGPDLDGKSGASPMIESNMCSQMSASCCAEIISNLQCTGDSVSGCDWHNQKDDLSSSDLSLESFTKPVESKSNDDICIKLLASKGCLSTLKTLLRAESLHTQQNAQSENKNVNGLTGDCVAEVFEVRTDVTAGTKVETSSEIIIAKENACNLKRDSFELGANCLCDKSSSLSCQPFDVVENGLPGRLDPPDLLIKDACVAISSSSSIGCYAQRENEGKDVVKADCVSETKHHPTTSSSSQMGSRKRKSSLKTHAKRAARNCRNTKLPHPHESIEFLFKASRRKRSCSSKPARSSIWGLFSNITQFLEPCPEPVCNEVQNQEPTKARGGRGNGKRSKNRAGQKSKGSSGLSNTSTSCLRLKIKVGKKVAPNNLNTVVAQVVDPSVSVDSSFSNYGKETNFQFPKLANVVEDKVGEPGSETQFQSKEDQEKVKTCSDASIMDVKLTNKVVGSAENLEKSAEDAADNYHVCQSDAVVEASGEAIENKYMDPRTSPDSEVINSIPDAQVGLIHQEESHDPVLNTSEALAFPEGVKSSKGSKRGKKDNHRSSAAASIRRKPKSSKNCRARQKTTGNEFVSSEALTSSTGANSSRENGLGVSEEAMKVEINMDAQACCSPDVPDTKNTKNLSSSKYKRNQLSKCSKSQRVSKGKSRVSDSVRSRKGNACKQRGDELKSISKSKVKEKGSDEEIVARGGKHPLTGNHISDDIEDSNTGNSITSADMVNVDLVSDGVMEQRTQSDNAWVRCDDCHKWRRIPVALVKSIDEACRWICGDNVNKAFADCSIPQEKSNANINAELGISDAEEDGCDGLNYRELEKGFESKHMTVPPPSHFWRINSNQFLRRSRKTQTIDEIMVCHCKRPPDGKLGCGDECLNRMLNIECVKGTCPCRDLCSNQQFQKRKYGKMKWDRFGKKGFGLRMLENISAGHFLIEYVGEVLDMQAYEARQKEYASRGQRHFYFMTLNGSEVIDAYVKGNLGRFINHSCDPNCRTEKWMVNGEICIGLFALRDIKKGEEVTFDYNYVRVFGAAAKKCHCGSPHCRGYIGGDPLSAEVIVHDDSDEESPEPKMLENGETWNGSDISRSSSFDGAAMQSVESVITGVIKLENMPEAEDSVNRSASATSKLYSSVDTEDLKGNFQLAIQPEGVLPMTVPCEAVQPDGTMEQKAMNKTSSSIQKLDISLNMSDNKLPSDSVDANKKSKFDTAEDKQVPPKSRPLMKTCRSSGSIKKGKISSNSLNVNKVQITSNKSQVHSVKPKKFSENSSTCRFEAVDEKLNELLDSEGGITKRKDASKGYLKLLLLTATSGDSGNGEAIQSNRELSMILDALLKTKSRLVLTDIINKNGLQMLHNIMKKYRMDFKKIPILRKLLKVLEYLAMREILTLEHINGGPPCAGRESFRESILSFTEHDDKQVHQIARNFRDRWIPKPIRKLSYRDKDGGRTEFHRVLDCNRVSASHNHWRDQAIRPTEAISCIMQSAVATSVDTSAREGCSSSSTVVCQINGTKIRKRKSRWDQPAETQKIDSRSPKKLEYSPLPVIVQSIPDHIDKMSTGDKECHDFVCKGEAINVDNGRNDFQEDVPPGFSSHPNASLVSSTAPSTATNFPQPNFCQLKCADAIMAYPQKRFISRLPVSYGIPLPILQQFGLPQGESVESWVIAPGMPFHPFPPLPPCPPNKKDNPPACAANSIGINEDAEEEQQDSRRPSTSYPDENIPSTAGGHPPDSDIPGTNIQQTFKRTRESSYDLGKKYFRQQKRKGPPWHKSECMGNNHIDGTCCIDVGNVKNELRNSNYSDDITCGVGEGRNDFYQQPQHPNQH